MMIDNHIEAFQEGKEEEVDIEIIIIEIKEIDKITRMKEKDININKIEKIKIKEIIDHIIEEEEIEKIDYLAHYILIFCIK